MKDCKYVVRVPEEVEGESRRIRLRVINVHTGKAVGPVYHTVSKALDAAGELNRVVEEYRSEARKAVIGMQERKP